MTIDTQLGDVHQILTYDGKSLIIPDGTTIFKAYGNYGAPPTEWITRRAYKQHGVTFVDFTITPRTISVSFFRAAACTRELYWAYRRELHDLLRPNRGGPITLILRQAGGEKRALTVRAAPGAILPPQAENNAWNIDEPLDFIAFDPFWFDPAATSQAVSLTADPNLVFPITFPIQFGIAGAQFIYPITYTGTWRSYPTLTLTGPYSSALITNSVTGMEIELIQGCAEGDSRIIILTPGSQSVKDSAGVNKFSDLSPGSNLVEFAILPDPEVPGGVQTITAVLQNAQIYSGTGWEVATRLLDPDRWYRMDDTTTTLIDRGGDGANGVLSGGYTQGVTSLVTADPNTATTFTGTGLGTLPTIEFQGVGYTINLLVNFASLAVAAVVFGVDGGTTTEGKEIAIGALTTGELIIIVGAGVSFASVAGLITPGTAYMITVKYDPATAIISGYINGVLVASGSTVDFSSASPSCWIGGYGASNPTNGTIDECQVWLGEVLTDAEITALYASRLVASRTYTASGFQVQFNTRYFAL